MKREWKPILCITAFMLIGACFGYLFVTTQHAQLSDPKYIRFWTDRDFPVPEPLTFLQGILGFSFLLAGIPAGAIIYRYFASQWFKSSAPKVLIAIITFPIYTMFGVICALPILLYKLFVVIILKR